MRISDSPGKMCFLLLIISENVLIRLRKTADAILDDGRKRKIPGLHICRNM